MISSLDSTGRSGGLVGSDPQHVSHSLAECFAAMGVLRGAIAPNVVKHCNAQCGYVATYYLHDDNPQSGRAGTGKTAWDVVIANRSRCLKQTWNNYYDPSNRN